MNSEKRTKPVVAIDGPAGAGKSTVTQMVAERLGYTRVDTGALYRTVALVCMQRGIRLDDAKNVSAVAYELSEPGAVELSTRGEQVTVHAFGVDITLEIRSREASLGASTVSQIPEVREALLSVQRQLGVGGGVVLEGRDIGSVVFPDAEAKFYLTASAKVRAERRRAELSARGEAPPLDEMILEVNERDRRDTERPISPLVQAVDAWVIDSSELTIEEVVEKIVARVRAIEKTGESSATREED
jgi:cytidylate kinase